MESPTESIKTTVRRNMMIIAAVSTSLLFLLWSATEYLEFLTESDAARRQFEETQKELLKHEVLAVTNLIDYRIKQTETALGKNVKDRVYEAHSIAANIYKENNLSKTPAEIQKMIKDALRPLRYNGGRGYYFIFNMEGIEELFADRPELEGQNMLPIRGARGEYVVKDMIDLVREKEEGFYEYTWTKPGERTNAFHKKAFVKHFAPYNWVIGTGEYVEDVREDIQNEVLQRIAALKFGKEGYFFGSVQGGLPLFTGGKVTKGSQSIWELTDPNGVKITQEQNKAIRNPDGGFVRYSWQKLDNPKPSPKISYVVGIPEWQWIVGAGVYLDSIEDEIAGKRSALLNQFIRQALVFFVLLSMLQLLILLWMKRLTGTIRSGTDTFMSFCKQAASESILIDSNSLKFQEFRDIARSMNIMLEERLQAYQGLLASEEKFRTLYENMVQGVFYQRQDGTLIDVNQAALDIFGLSRNEFLARPSTDPEWQVIREDGTPLDGMDHPSMVALRSGKPVIDYVAGITNRQRNGVVWININAIPQFKDGEGKPYQVFVTLHDITSRKNIEEALRESAEQFRTLTALAPVGIYLSSPEGQCQYVNECWCTMAGLTQEEALGEGWLASLHPDDRDTVLANWQKMADSEGHWGLEYRFQTADGKVTWVNGLATPLRDASGRVISYIGINIDITERKIYEDERQKLERQLQQAQKMEAIGTLAGGIAHDFNNILGALLGYAEMARDDSPPDSSVRRDLGEILKAGHRAKELVKQILAFSRQDASERQPTSAADIIREAVNMLRPSLPSTIDIRQDLADDAGHVFADPSQLHQVVINLCTNAYHAMEETGGILNISLRSTEFTADDFFRDPHLEPGKFVQISVSDTGEGMSPEIRARIFEPYFTTKETGKGTGLGLSIIHGIVKSHGGHISCASIPGEGSVFHVFLPVMPDQELAETATLAPIHGGKEHILFIDDEEMLAGMARTMLERLGYTVTVKNSSLEALTSFQNQPELFDLVITDQTMPGMTGIDLARRMLQIRPDLPVILCTGFSAQISEERARAIGIREFAFKPLAKKDIARLIRKVLDSGKNLEQF